MPWPNHTPLGRDGNLPGWLHSPHGKTPREFLPKHPPSRGSPSRSCLATNRDACQDRSLNWLDPSRPVGPDHEGPSPDFPCGAAAAPRREATLPDLRDPLRGPGVAVSVSRLNDAMKIDRTNHFGQVKMVTSFRAFSNCFASSRALFHKDSPGSVEAGQTTLCSVGYPTPVGVWDKLKPLLRRPRRPSRPCGNASSKQLCRQRSSSASSLV